MNDFWFGFVTASIFLLLVFNFLSKNSEKSYVIIKESQIERRIDP